MRCATVHRPWANLRCQVKANVANPISQDSYNGLFQRRDPKEAGPLLDIERAMSKLEKVAIRYRKKKGKPLVLVFNNVHFLKDDDVGDGILHLIQQRAESWAASQCANV